ncbi:MAG: FAD-dependent thymidylate synthase [Synergistaceae bacterium]|nr:FAD-dependent thymidylate synthase [Synergistaceae bacterium]
MKVELLTSSESIAEMEKNTALAVLTCHDNAEREHVPAEVLTRIIKAGHESILEHINLTYSVKGLSRACLQELARHRHISLSVESTRHTLKKKIEDTTKFLGELPEEYLSLAQSFALFVATTPDLSNDELKYYLPEFWPTNLVLTSNVRELRHILDLRTAPAALKEFRDLARAMYEAVPEEFKYLLKDCVHEEASHE